MKLSLVYLLTGLLFFSSCEEGVENSDLTENIVGTYSGQVTLKIGSPEASSVDNQDILIEKIDDTKIRLTPVTYPGVSPVDTLSFEVELTQTPFGFINTPGVMLTVASEDFAEGSVSGTPFSLNSVQQDAHGKFDQNTNELVFALEIVKNGVSDFEFYTGVKK